MSDTVQKIKDALAIVDVVQPYVKLTRAGKYFKGISPFTKEKTPSFFVSPERGLYHCFSSGKGGDMFTFIEEIEGVDFRGALKILAEKAGIPLVVERPGERDMRERLFAALAEANEFFVLNLASRTDAMDYLVTRGLTKETIREWTLGYAPKEWQSLHGYLLGKGFTENELERAGLIKKPDTGLPAQAGEAGTHRYYDRFRGRIMFPIRDVSNRVIAFSGRIFEDDPVHPQAKYLNSPEGDVFDKSKALYGIEKAREGIRTLHATILVEGQMDLLLAHQAGYHNTVATSGTAFTDKHAELIKRHTENLLIAYDGDRAGIAAAGRAAAIALGKGMNVKIAKLPPGSDPADLIKENPESFKTAVKGGLHVVDFYLAHLMDAHYDARTFRLEVSRTVLPYVAMIQNKIDQAHFVQRVAEVLSVEVDAVKAELKKVSNPSATMSNAVPTVGEPFLSRVEALERLILGIEGKTTETAALFEADLFLERYPENASREAAVEELRAELLRERKHEEYRETVRALRAAEAAQDTVQAEQLMKTLTNLALHLK